MHKPIQFKDLGLCFPHKTCFSDFSGQICYGNRIAIIGRNGEGKSMLLKILQGDEPSNHLDLTNRRALKQYLSRYSGTVMKVEAIASFEELS